MQHYIQIKCNLTQKFRFFYNITILYTQKIIEYNNNYFNHKTFKSQYICDLLTNRILKKEEKKIIAL